MHGGLGGHCVLDLKIKNVRMHKGDSKMKNFSKVPQLPAKAAYSDLSLFELMIGVWSDFIGLLGDILGFLGDFQDFFASDDAE